MNLCEDVLGIVYSFLLFDSADYRTVKLCSRLFYRASCHDFQRLLQNYESYFRNRVVEYGEILTECESCPYRKDLYYSGIRYFVRKIAQFEARRYEFIVGGVVFLEFPIDLYSFDMDDDCVEGYKRLPVNVSEEHLTKFISLQSDYKYFPFVEDIFSDVIMCYWLSHYSYGFANAAMRRHNMLTDHSLLGRFKTFVRTCEYEWYGYHNRTRLERILWSNRMTIDKRRFSVKPFTPQCRLIIGCCIGIIALLIVYYRLLTHIVWFLCNISLVVFCIVCTHPSFGREEIFKCLKNLVCGAKRWERIPITRNVKCAR